MRNWQLNNRVNLLSRRLAAAAKTDTRIDWNCLTEPERQLLLKFQEITDKYAPAMPPKDVIEKNADLWYKGLEIFGRRATELFVEVVPDSFCCDELEEWYFKIYFYNFWLDWMDSVKELRAMRKEQHDELLCERREMGMLDKVFRLHRNQPETEKKEAPEETKE
jgi:hypothetical protein